MRTDTRHDGHGVLGSTIPSPLREPQQAGLPRPVPDSDARVRVDGRIFALDGRPFPFVGATYGTFHHRASDQQPYPDTAQLQADLAAMRAAGLTVVRTYTPPPTDLLDATGGLRVLAGLFQPDWRWRLDGGRREQAREEREAVRIVRREARRLAGDPRVLGVCLANEIPADVVRWVGTRHVRAHLRRLAETVREIDPELLVTYANYPSAEYLAPELLDFVTFNVFLERDADLRRYLARLLNHTGGLPLVLGELGRHTGDEPAAEADGAAWLERQLQVATEAGVAGTCVFSWTDDWAVAGRPVTGWRFGLTRADRSPRPALDVLAAAARRTVADVRDSWPSLSVVICAYNAADTLEECLAHTVALDYPGLEVIVVDDGSTDDTRAIAERYTASGVRVIGGAHAGLSAARNTGWQAATGELVVFLDSDAYPTPYWPYHLALAFEDPTVGAAGGPNVGPVNDPMVAHCVAAAPGGPDHVLFDDVRAEHVPGCNLAVRRDVLAETGGFDPIYRTAGDDVDLCWRVLDRDHHIAFAPAALVWHHRRSSVRAYLRQQRGYGRAEALVAAHHPDRCNAAGNLRWHGHIYTSLPRLFAPGRIYRGLAGTAPFQSIYAGSSGWDDVAHQIGVPLAVMIAVVSGLAAPLLPAAAWPVLGAVLAVLALGAADTWRAARSRSVPAGWRAPLLVAMLSLTQPIVRRWGHWRQASALATPEPAGAPLLPYAATRRRVAFGVDRPRAEIVAALVGRLRAAGLRVHPLSGWEDHDGQVDTSALASTCLVTSEHPPGVVQAKLVVRPRWRRLALAAAVAAAAALLGAREALVVLVALVAFDLVRAAARTARARRCLRAAAR